MPDLPLLRSFLKITNNNHIVVTIAKVCSWVKSKKHFLPEKPNKKNKFKFQGVIESFEIYVLQYGAFFDIERMVNFTIGLYEF